MIVLIKMMAIMGPASNPIGVGFGKCFSCMEVEDTLFLQISVVLANLQWWGDLRSRC
jgi:hypothetical protein